MYRNARPLPLGGFRVGGSSSRLDNGPTPEQQASKAAYEARIEAERQRFSREVDAAQIAFNELGPVWRLMVFAVPDRLGGLLARLGFKPTKKNPSHWWRVFDPARDKAAAEEARGQLLAAGLKGKWSQVKKQTPKAKPYIPGYRNERGDKPVFDRGSQSTRKGWPLPRARKSTYRP